MISFLKKIQNPSLSFAHKKILDERLAEAKQKPKQFYDT
jgi:hypothetical protein